MDTKYKFNIDRLEVTYTCSKEWWDYMSQQDTFVCGENGDVVLKREKNLTYHQTFSVYCSDMPVGELIFDSPNPNRPYVYLHVCNEILYTCVAGLSYIEQALNLTYYRISKLDICFDTNRNVIRRFYHLLKDESQTIIINNKAVKDRTAAIKEIMHVSQGSLKNPRLTQTAYVHGNEIDVKIYDKREEMEDRKEYIKENLRMDKKIYRVEVRIPNHKQVCKALKMSGVDMDNLYYYPFGDNLEAIFIRNLNRVIRLKNKECILNYLLQK